MTDLKAAAEAAKAATAAYIANPTDRDTGRQWDRACAEFSLACTEDAILALYAERDEARSRVAEAEAERDDAVNWSAIVDRHGLDGFDALADTWLRMEAIQRLNNAVTSVFAKWANNELMGRFKEHITNVMHESFVEGCIVGVRAELVETTKATARAEAAEAALSAERAEVERAVAAERAAWEAELRPLVEAGAFEGADLARCDKCGALLAVDEVARVEDGPTGCWRYLTGRDKDPCPGDNRKRITMALTKETPHG